MGDHKQETVSQGTLTNGEILTERKVRRRAFLSTTGVLLAGGAATVVAGVRATAQDVTPQGDPNRQQPADPNQQPPADPPRQSDPDRPTDQRQGDAKPTDKRRSDPDKTGDRKRGDPDKTKQTDPDKPRPQDPSPPPR
ncbi:MAG TPA: hypothetical protein VGZ29_10570 [Terriglobia bacterium]|nr:hypothetical protein [Terriglobia bacterium]